MRSFVLLCFAICMCCATALAQDAVKADPKHYSVVSENDQVRILKLHYGPHEKSVMHSHPNLVAVFLSDGKVKMTTPDGKTQEMSATKGQAMWTDAGTHLPENVGDTALDGILVELKGKGPAKTASAKAPAKAASAATKK
jgi:quercetin dioxygenase-like cupin family protein